MRRIHFPCFISAAALAWVLWASRADAQRAPIPFRTRDPYQGAIVVDAADGTVVFEDRADELGYPASMLKLMDLLLILEDVERQRLQWTDPVRVTAEAARIGGSQVYLAEGEVFTVEDLTYALIIQSANDAAVALAIHIAGTVAAFVERMNAKARELGMSRTVFYSVHGLPPSAGQQPDVTTARDMSKLCLALARRPDAFRFTRVPLRVLREGTPKRFEMRTHNNLLLSFPGCDGFKTGYFRLAGYSIAATAQSEGARAIVVVLGSPTKEGRDTVARKLLAAGLATAKSRRPPAQSFPTVSTNTSATASASTAQVTTTAIQTAETPTSKLPSSRRRWWPWALGAMVVVFLVVSYRRQQWGR